MVGNTFYKNLPPLLTLGNPLLARPARPVAPEEIPTEEFQEKLGLLKDAMAAYEGIGIAAPQVGWDQRFFLMTLGEPGVGGEPEQETEVWINPELHRIGEELNWAWEGCLSVPGLRGWIHRPAAIAVKGLDARGGEIGRELDGWEARVFQHEYDHLEGLLFPYRALDPRHIVTLEELERRADWPAGWPAPGARDAPMGEVAPDPPPGS